MNTISIRVYPEDSKKLQTQIKNIFVKLYPDLEKLNLSNAFLFNQVINFVIENSHQLHK